jgi:hypothetical protein
MLCADLPLTQACTMQCTDVDLLARLLRFRGEQIQGERNVTLPTTEFVHDLLTSHQRDPEIPFVFWSTSGVPIGTPKRTQRIVESLPNNDDPPRAEDASPALGRHMLHNLRRTYAEPCRAERLPPTRTHSYSALRYHGLSSPDISTQRERTTEATRNAPRIA